MYFYAILGVLTCFLGITGNIHYLNRNRGLVDERYGHFSESERLQMVEEAKQMFFHGYDNYLRHAFPQDELDPIHCAGRGPDIENP